MEGTEAAPAAKKKTDLKLFGEIDKRVAELSAPGRTILEQAIVDGIPQSEIETVRQVVGRFNELSDQGRKYVEGQLEIDRDSE